MRVNETLLLNFLVWNVMTGLGGHSSAHWVAILVCKQNFVPQLVDPFHVTMNKEAMRPSWHRVHSFTCCSRFDSLVTAEDFRPRFFKNKWPNFNNSIVFWRSCEGPSIRVCVVGEVVVYDNLALLAVHIYWHSIASGTVHFLRYEDLLYAIRFLSQWRQSG